MRGLKRVLLIKAPAFDAQFLSDSPNLRTFSTEATYSASTIQRGLQPSVLVPGPVGRHVFECAGSRHLKTDGVVCQTVKNPSALKFAEWTL